MQWLFLLPEQCWILLLAGAGICFMLGFRKFALGIVSTVVLLALLSPFIESAVGVVCDSLSTPMLALVMVVLMIAFGLWLIGLVCGKGTKDHVAGEIISKAIIFILTLPFKIMGIILRGIRRV